MKVKIGLIAIAIAIIVMLAKHYLVNQQSPIAWLSFATVLLLVIGLLLVIPFNLIPFIIFDNHEWIANDSSVKLVKKLRLRAVLFNNISVIVFIATLLVIIAGFYVLIHPVDSVKVVDPANVITVRVSATAILIFLVQILFRAFKYLLRVAAFYNGKADALEFHAIKPETELDKIMDMFTPDKYDISDLGSPSLFDKLPGK
ncbi:hypothetical protein ACFQZS_12730 [Mucilaginibacter calamicampi]|uniref:Uncharacterized protein n=1 Tax=Mucilaginibacter calamicampi TaxID=1302352 RepID=A0ABW2YX05_9SPHI